ncbi:MAG: response regulator [Bacteroidales bacterium]|nr:response regulator [Bacteroidales bacterium]
MNNQSNTLIILIVLLTVIVSFLIIAYIDKLKTIKSLKQVEQIRSDIFAKITHEFRTPLTTILGLSRQMREMKDISPNHSVTFLSAIERQSKNLSFLINQLLDITNLQSEVNTIEWKTGNIVSFVNMVTESFAILASGKDIDLQFFSKEKEVETDFVPDYLNKILNNLIGNAIKYSEGGTHIYVMTEISEKDKKKFIIKVIDNGVGISKDDLPYLFDLFYQTNQNKVKEGNGIGLTITKQLVEVSGGKIDVMSEPGKGTTFTITIPIQVSEKILYSHWKQDVEAESSYPSSELTNSTDGFFIDKISKDDTRYTILLVEDNKDIAIFIRSIFPNNKYNIVYCSNGEDAYKLVESTVPDIIITDIIMPKKNGIELIKDIKTSSLLNHIPIIIISAKNRNEDIYEGLKVGADTYLAKPFQPEELKIRVNNLLASRNLLIEKYRRTVLKEDKNSDIRDEVSANAEFLRLATDLIYREMKNPDFTPTMLSEELAISMSQLNKKLNAITGYPTSTYILQVKLSNAKKLLSNESKTIGEIAAECGIYDVNYFSRVFKRHTGFTPTQFRRLPQTNNIKQTS